MVRPCGCRLEGFKDPWETTVFKGRMMLPDKTLEECGVPSGAQLISVRRVLVPEGDSVHHHLADSFVSVIEILSRVATPSHMILAASLSCTFN